MFVFLSYRARINMIGNVFVSWMFVSVAISRLWACEAPSRTRCWRTRRSCGCGRRRAGRVARETSARTWSRSASGASAATRAGAVRRPRSTASARLLAAGPTRRGWRAPTAKRISGDFFLFCEVLNYCFEFSVCLSVRWKNFFL